MIVIDSSALIDSFFDDRLLDCLFTIIVGNDVIAPDHLDIECVSALRRLDRLKPIDGNTLDGLIDSLKELKCVRISVQPFLKEIWSLRNNFSTYDAAYVVLAIDTNSTLITHDNRLANAASKFIDVRRLDSSSAP